MTKTSSNIFRVISLALAFLIAAPVSPQAQVSEDVAAQLAQQGGLSQGQESTYGTTTKVVTGIASGIVGGATAVATSVATGGAGTAAGVGLGILAGTAFSDFIAPTIAKLFGDEGKARTVFTTPNGAVYVEISSPDGVDIVGKEGEIKGCKYLPQKLYESKECFFCPLFAVIYQAADDMTVISISKLAAAFAVVLVIGLAIWIAVQTLAHVSSLTKQDAPKFLGNLIKQSFKFLISFILLISTAQIFLYLINPLLAAGLEFGGSLLSLPNDLEFIQGSTVTTTYFSADLYTVLERFITAVQNEIGFMQAVGSSLMCIGSNIMISLTDFGDGFQMFITGFVLAAFGFLLGLAFAFYLIDAVVQLGIVGALLPFLIACWPFKLTSKYTTTGFNMLMNTFFVFVFMGLVVSVNIQLIDSALSLTSSEETTTTEKASGSEQQEYGALTEIADAINNGRIEGTDDKRGLKELTDISGTGFLILLFCCIFGFKLTNQVGSLAGKMASGAMKSIAPSIATMGGSATLSAGKKLTQPTREAVSEKATLYGEKALGWTGHQIGRPFRAMGRFIRTGSFRGGGNGNGDGNTNTPRPTPNPEASSGGNTPSTTQARKTTARNEVDSAKKKKDPITLGGGARAKTHQERPGHEQEDVPTGSRGNNQERSETSRANGGSASGSAERRQGQSEGGQASGASGRAHNNDPRPENAGRDNNTTAEKEITENAESRQSAAENLNKTRKAQPRQKGAPRGRKAGGSGRNHGRTSQTLKDVLKQNGQKR